MLISVGREGLPAKPSPIAVRQLPLLLLIENACPPRTLVSEQRKYIPCLNPAKSPPLITRKMSRTMTRYPRDPFLSLRHGRSGIHKMRLRQSVRSGK
jgi:hypothetical protein